MNHIVTFKKGDLVPEWVLIAPSPEKQEQARFDCDVTVSHCGDESFPTGPVVVEWKDADAHPIRVIGDGSGNWCGAPTHFVLLRTPNYKTPNVRANRRAAA